MLHDAKLMLQSDRYRSAIDRAYYAMFHASRAALHMDSLELPKTHAGAQVSPFLRGFTGYHVLHLIDGIRLNNSTFRLFNHRLLHCANSRIKRGIYRNLETLEQG